MKTLSVPDNTNISQSDADFEKPVRTSPFDGEEGYSDALLVNIDGYEGPLDLLLDLARRQKVDILKISVSALVEQYLIFVEEAKRQRLDIAAEYLVMASWLTYLKSKMLLPKDEQGDEEPTAAEMAARLAFQLKRLQAMRQASDLLLQRPQQGVAFLTRGMPEGIRLNRKSVWNVTLRELLAAYTSQRVRGIETSLTVTSPKVFQIEEARQRLAQLLGDIPDWTDLESLAPIEEVDAPRASIIASAFNASLEFAKSGALEIRQAGAFHPVFIRPLAATIPAQEKETDHGA